MPFNIILKKDKDKCTCKGAYLWFIPILIDEENDETTNFI
tara:strand:+ start:354 stop:473 length:120 start_codon:yes stop_codon:yes gene_type:complete